MTANDIGGFYLWKDPIMMNIPPPWIENPAALDLPASLAGGGLILPFDTFIPNIGEDVFVASHASVIGRVSLGERVSIWYGSVLRGDIAEIQIGQETNLQDQCVVHVGLNEPTLVGCRVTVGHQVILHGCQVGDECVIGMGSILLNGSRIGEGSVIGAGSLVTQGMDIPAGCLAYGRPARVVRPITDSEHKENEIIVQRYVELTRKYRGMP